MGRWFIPAGIAACYVGFAVTVHLRMLDGLDIAVRRASYPGDQWGSLQLDAARFARMFRPTHLVLPLLLLVAAVSAFRRSLRPFVVLAVFAAPVAVATAGTKFVMRRWDSGIYPVGHGSFPSGHTVAMTAAFGLAVLLVRPGTRWGWLVPIVMGAAMGSALIIAPTHPTTDVIGAGLLVTAALTAATAADLGHWAAFPRYRKVEPEPVR
jgi:membrane-associated phospholipid phosphatase